MSGKVFLVGAGPGDPGLLTLKAARLLATAETVVLDALVSPEIRAMIPPAAEIIYAGKRASRHTLTQDEINALLVDLGKKGKRVVRFKGGDPFVFGRGGEEAEALRQAGVAFEIVPGVTSSIAGPAYAGVPVTHRTLSTSFTVITGHESDSSSGVDFEVLAKIPGTLVFLMGLSQLDNITSRLIAEGKRSSTPVAVVSRATTPLQRSVRGTLADIGRIVKEASIEPPALVVIGDVVTMQPTLSWFETKPLFGKSVVVTRARTQASELAALLEDAGARVLQFPMIEIVPPPSFDSLDAVIESLSGFDLLVFSSTNGVDSFFERLHSKSLDARSLAGRKIAAVGKSTAEQLKQHGVVADIIPEKFQSSALLPHLPEHLAGSRIAVIRAKAGNDEFLEELRSRGAIVELAVAYETRPAAEGRDELIALLNDGKIDAVTFTSGSTVDNFFEAIGGDVSRSSLARVSFVSIGPVTTAALQRHRFTPAIEARSADVAAVAEVVQELFAATAAT